MGDSYRITVYLDVENEVKCFVEIVTVGDIDELLDNVQKLCHSYGILGRAMSIIVDGHN